MLQFLNRIVSLVFGFSRDLLLIFMIVFCFRLFGCGSIL